MISALSNPRAKVPHFEEPHSESLQNCFPEWTILHSHQQPMKILVCTYPPALVIVSVIIAIIVGVKWYHIVVLFCISLIASDVGHLFLCVLSIHISSLEKCVF